MKFAQKTDKIFTIIYTVASVLLIAISVLSLLYAGNIMNYAGNTLNTGNYSADDITAGYRIVGQVFSGGLYFAASVFLYAIAICSALFALPLIIITAYAYVGMSLYKKTANPVHIKRNLIVKIIYTAILTILALIMTISDVGFVVILVILVLVLSLLFGALYAFYYTF